MKNTASSITENFGMSPNLVNNLFILARNRCTIKLKTISFIPGETIEIDESCISRHKYHKGRHRTTMHTWVFGMIRRVSGIVRLFVVSDMTTETLIPIITRWIPRRNTIMSNGWTAYTGLTALGYKHSVVIHEE